MCHPPRRDASSNAPQRLSSTASLQRSLVELYQQSPDAFVLSSPQPTSRSFPHPGYPTTGPFPDHMASSSSSSRRLHADSRSRSPSRSPYLPHPRDTMLSENPRKRHRTSHSPHPSYSASHEPPPLPHPADHLPPSPYSSSERSQSAEHSPRSRASMAIGSLLSDDHPRREIKEDPSHK